jgi:hypothetical protein
VPLQEVRDAADDVIAVGPQIDTAVRVEVDSEATETGRHELRDAHRAGE